MGTNVRKRTELYCKWRPMLAWVVLDEHGCFANGSQAVERRYDGRGESVMPEDKPHSQPGQCVDEGRARV